MPQPKIVKLEGFEAQALIDALEQYGPSRVGSHTLFGVLMRKLESEHEYKYERLPEFSRGLDEDCIEANIALKELRELFAGPRLAEGENDATPLLDELGKIIDALDQSNGTDPQSVADPEADELFEEQEHYEDGMGSASDSGV